MSFVKVAAAAALAAAMAFSAASANAKTYKIATEGAFPPFNTIDSSGKPQGFDIDIALALCAEAKIECQIVTQDWDGMIPGLLAKKFDAVSASMSITEERLKAVDFTEPYYTNRLQFIAPKGKDFTLTVEGLKGKVVGAQRATVSAEWMEKNMPGVETKVYGTQEEAFLDLAAGRTDLVLNDAYVSYAWLSSKDGANFEYKGKPVFEDDKIGIALRKGDKDLKGKLDAALKAILANGTYQKINAKYFPFSIY